MLLSNGQTWAAAATVFQKPRDVWHVACPLLLSLPVGSVSVPTLGHRWGQDDWNACILPLLKSVLSLGAESV